MGQVFIFYTESGRCLESLLREMMGADMIVTFQRILGRHINIKATERYVSCAGKRD